MLIYCSSNFNVPDKQQLNCHSKTTQARHSEYIDLSIQKIYNECQVSSATIESSREEHGYICTASIGQKKEERGEICLWMDRAQVFFLSIMRQVIYKAF
jgi:hypothetical protein